jgi:phosphoribosylamine--glycine ligase
MVVGNGAREHALVWHLARSPRVSAIIVAPGNAGIATIAACYRIGISDIANLCQLARDQQIDFVIVGPEAPLTLGLVDQLTRMGILALGPSAAAARLEGSKAYTKAICTSHNIPTARYETFSGADAAKAYISQQGAPIVVKADGLAAGKGVVVADTVEVALAAVDQLLDPALGGCLVVEECLVGEEVSFFALCDGTRAISLGAAQDHKRAFDGDKGPNTGGMGAYGPPPIFTPALEQRVMAEIISPTLAAMAEKGAPFYGVLFAGLMITPAGDPKLIEFNVRLGDPETQVLMMRADGDLLPVFLAAARGDLRAINPPTSSGAAICVVMAADGYPGTPVTGTRITLPEKTPPGAQIFHAGTGRDGDGALCARGGRVLSVCAHADTLAKAGTLAYDVLADIDWPQGFYRRDIGWRALRRD